MKKLLIMGLALVSLMACKNENPLLTEQNTPYGVPAFDKVKIEHYLPAFDQAIAAYEAEVAAIVNTLRSLPLPTPLKHLIVAAVCWTM
jgi:peptidyl-dipeptidase Dcp